MNPRRVLCHISVLFTRVPLRLIEVYHDLHQVFEERIFLRNENHNPVNSLVPMISNAILLLKVAYRLKLSQVALFNCTDPKWQHVFKLCSGWIMDTIYSCIDTQSRYQIDNILIVIKWSWSNQNYRHYIIPTWTPYLVNTQVIIIALNCGYWHVSKINN